MTDSAGAEMLVAMLDAITLIQEQLEAIDARGKRIEAQQGDILGQLDRMTGARPGGDDLASQLDVILSELREGRAAAGLGLARVAEVAGWAHAAAIGSPDALPVDVIDDPLLERFVLSQPAAPTSTVRALADWRRVAQRVDTAQLIAILCRQYQPSPTDDAKGRMLRYQLAAISRDELAGRGAALPAPPPSTYPEDRSEKARRARSAELLRLWRAGEGAALYAEPELAGAVDILDAARSEAARMPEADAKIGLADLADTIACRLGSGERPKLATGSERLGPSTGIDR